ncbi:hypothetical protein SAMN05444339_11012 [Loktanella atrilutea]|uniref:Uncharacterized protein n=1 Tax=Loktanella atrilutea TaxID=366533 RepID=A0A1M5DJ61_LOKAT|nr:hypothetical protein SAMN05444339_11012 [Loktanella atrilutea]
MRPVSHDALPSHVHAGAGHGSAGWPQSVPACECDRPSPCGPDRPRSRLVESRHSAGTASSEEGATSSDPFGGVVGDCQSVQNRTKIYRHEIKETTDGTEDAASLHTARSRCLVSYDGRNPAGGTYASRRAKGGRGNQLCLALVAPRCRVAAGDGCGTDDRHPPEPRDGNQPHDAPPAGGSGRRMAVPGRAVVVATGRRSTERLGESFRRLNVRNTSGRCVSEIVGSKGTSGTLTHSVRSSGSNCAAVWLRNVSVMTSSGPFGGGGAVSGECRQWHETEELPLRRLYASLTSHCDTCRVPFCRKGSGKHVTMDRRLAEAETLRYGAVAAEAFDKGASCVIHDDRS